ncbi:MAG: SEC-C metal-binding domain-containing protein [Bryobacteraceae bacterium]
MGWWACFRDNRPVGVTVATPASAKADLKPAALSRIKSTKTGRNEPCPCGSGKNIRNAAADEHLVFHRSLGSAAYNLNWRILRR